MRSWSSAVLVFGTSATVLVLEILALRLVAPYVGESLEVSTAVIGVVLAGIAAGSALGGRLADRRDPRPLVGPTLVVGGALAWMSLFLVDRLGPEVGEGPTSIVYLTTVAFFLPAAVLSAVSPMVAKLRLGDLGETGTVVGGLSAAGTAGALVGTFVTGFVLVATLPVRSIVLATGAVLVVTGIVLWLRLSTRAPGRGPYVTLVALALAAGMLGVSSTSPCEAQTRYFCARVDVDPANPSGRILWLDTVRHSYVDLDDPRNLDFRYVRLFADAVDGVTPDGAIDALHIGGGGFTFPRYLAATRPGSRSEVLEIDPDLVDLAREELGLETGPELAVTVGDARLTIEERPTGAYDVVVGDAFGGMTVPWHLTTVEMLREVERVLTADGLYVVNVIDGGDRAFARAETATLRHVFDHVAVVVPPGGVTRSSRNYVLAASDAALDGLAVDAADGRLLSGPDVDDFVDGAGRLTDDYAPVDQLVTR